MAHASRKHIGEGSQGKGDGSGAMTHMDLDKIGPNDILSNLDPIAIIIIVSAAGNKALGNFD